MCTYLHVCSGTITISKATMIKSDGTYIGIDRPIEKNISVERDQHI